MRVDEKRALGADREAPVVRDGEGEDRRDRRVGRVPAGFEDLKARADGFRPSGRDDAVRPLGLPASPGRGAGARTLRDLDADLIEERLLVRPGASRPAG